MDRQQAIAAPGTPPTAFDRFARIIERLCALPAVATLDWADQAAAALTEISDQARAVVLIASIEASGAVAAYEAAGVGSSRSLMDHPDTANAELSLRSRAERVIELGFRPAGGVQVSAAGDLIPGGVWRDTGLGKLWVGLGATDLLVAVGPLGAVEAGRSLVVAIGQIATPASASSKFSNEHAAMLKSAMPLLLTRTLLSVGAKRSTSARWLTAREQLVLEQLTLGKSVREIAEEIGRSPHTVHDHVKSLHRKLNASSRGELVARALGYLDEDRNIIKPGAMIEPKPAPGADRARSLADAVRGEGGEMVIGRARPTVEVDWVRRRAGVQRPMRPPDNLVRAVRPVTAVTARRRHPRRGPRPCRARGGCSRPAGPPAPRRARPARGTRRPDRAGPSPGPARRTNG
jgi:DNA-binding CsgD family transcriptional regulator